MEIILSLIADMGTADSLKLIPTFHHKCILQYSCLYKLSSYQKKKKKKKKKKRASVTQTIKLRKGFMDSILREEKDQRWENIE